MIKSKLKLLHGTLNLPVFLPDATSGFVRSLDTRDLKECKIEALMMNAFHLMQHPGSSVIKKFKGLHNYCSWHKPIITDSGGFQAYSMIKQNSQYGKITDNGIIYRPENSKNKINLTPEKSIQVQMSYEPDAVICLDDCTHPDDPEPIQKQSVERTIKWAKQCKKEYNRIINQKKQTPDKKPLIFAVIQGGNRSDLRKKCALALLDIGFDGYGYGGYPIDSQGNLMIDMLKTVRQSVPEKYPLLALGIGHPLNIIKCIKIGYSIFDCSLPTRDARSGRLYVIDYDNISNNNDSWFSCIYINDQKHIRKEQPVSDKCDCLACSNYSIAFLHHLFKRKDALYSRLATIHNLKSITRAMGSDPQFPITFQSHEHE